MVIRENHVTTRLIACLVLIALGLVALGLIYQLAQTVPDLADVRPRQHAVDRHGNSALAARIAVRNCVAPLIWFCPGTARHPPTFTFACVDETGQRCAALIVGTKGAELTAYTIPCSRLLVLMERCFERAVPAMFYKEARYE